MITSRRGFIALLVAIIAVPRKLFAAAEPDAIHVRFTRTQKTVQVPFVGPDGRIWSRRFEMPQDQAEFDAFVGRRPPRYGRPFVELEPNFGKRPLQPDTAYRTVLAADVEHFMKLARQLPHPKAIWFTKYPTG